MTKNKLQLTTKFHLQKSSFFSYDKYFFIHLRKAIYIKAVTLLIM